MVVVAMSIIASVFELLFIVLGDALTRARPNWWFGLRTPWTLSNDRVWERTHRVGGHLFVGLGIVAALVTLVNSYVSILVVAGLGAAMSLATVIYSYVAWRQETSR